MFSFISLLCLLSCKAHADVYSDVRQATITIDSGGEAHAKNQKLIRRAAKVHSDVGEATTTIDSGGEAQPHYWVDDACSMSRVGYWGNGKYRMGTEKWGTGVMCCDGASAVNTILPHGGGRTQSQIKKDTEGVKCHKVRECTTHKSMHMTYGESEWWCAAFGKRLCTKTEVLAERCCGESGNIQWHRYGEFQKYSACDISAFWTSRSVVMVVVTRKIVDTQLSSAALTADAVSQKTKALNVIPSATWSTLHRSETSKTTVRLKTSLFQSYSTSSSTVLAVRFIIVLCVYVRLKSVGVVLHQ